MIARGTGVYFVPADDLASYRLPDAWCDAPFAEALAPWLSKTELAFVTAPTLLDRFLRDPARRSHSADSSVAHDAFVERLSNGARTVRRARSRV
jgi:hypothetical protein